MPLDIHRVRTISSEQNRAVGTAKRNATKALEAYKTLGGDFTSDALFSREYSNLNSAIKDAERALDKVTAAIKAVDNKAR